MDTLCANTELLDITATGERWKKGGGRKAVFDGGYYEKLIDTYSAELTSILSDKLLATRLHNTVKGEVYRRLDAIAYDRYILDQYADITKSGRLEIYNRRDASFSDTIFVQLTEHLPDGDIHDYGTIFSYDCDDHNDHPVNNYLSLKSFVILRESVFGKTKTSITLDYRESRPVGRMVLRPLLYTDGMFNRESKLTRVEVLPPMGKYSIYAQYLRGISGDNTLIHVGTDSGYLLPLGVSRTRFEENCIEVQIDNIFEKAPLLLDAALADPKQFARFEWGAITGRFVEIEKHNKVIRDLQKEEQKARDEKATIEKEEREQQKVIKYNARIDEIAVAIEQSQPISVNYNEYDFDGRNPVLDLFKLYDIELPLRTKGWVNSGLAEITSSGYRYYSSKAKGNSKVFNNYLELLRAAIRIEPINIKRTKTLKQEIA